MVSKLLNTTNTRQKANEMPILSPKVESLLKGGSTSNTALYLDTCYLLGVVKSGRSVVKTLERLSTMANVILTHAVMKEFEKNVAALDLGKKRSSVLAEVSMIAALAQTNQNIMIEDVPVSSDEMAMLSNTMRANSTKGNSRVGAGEASIIKHINTVGTSIFSKVFVFSEDSDVASLTSGMNVSLVTSF